MTLPVPSGGLADAHIARAKRANSPQWIASPAVAIECGVCQRTLSRWTRDATLGFPKPYYVNGRIFFDRAEVDAWKNSRMAGGR
jgi:predicted DNA-binding transcriptional regulator AlpA